MSTALTGNEKNVEFGWEAAEDLISELGHLFTSLGDQGPQRAGAANRALIDWQGAFALDFAARVRACLADAEALSTAFRALRTQVQHLEQAAREEQRRREEARAWKQRRDHEAWLLREYHHLVGGGEAPPVLGSSGPPSFPALHHTVAPPMDAHPGSHGTSAVSSADPASLLDYAGETRGLDTTLRGVSSRVASALDEFGARTQWGRIDGASLMGALSQFLLANEKDTDRVATIGSAFSTAGSQGFLGAIPDVALAAMLTRAGLGAGRAGLTWDDPRSFGFQPTTGYADDPVDTASGNFLEIETDLDAPARSRLLRVVRTYNSRSRREGAFGTGWSSWADARLRRTPEGAAYRGPDGQEVTFPRDGEGFGRVPGVFCRVEPADGAGDGLRMYRPEGETWIFDGGGFPLRIEQGPGTLVSFDHRDGRLVAMSAATGRVIRWEWEGDRVAAVTSDDGRRVRYRYDDGALIGASGSRPERTYELDERGRVAAVVDADGVVEVRSAFDDEGRVLEQWSPHGRHTHFAYLPGNVLVIADDEEGPSNTYVHDEGRLVALIDGHGERLTISYDRRGHPVAVVERNGAATVQQWDAHDRLVRRAVPEGAVTSWAYDELDRVVSVETAPGGMSRLSYDREERIPAAVEDPLGGVTRREVFDGAVQSVTDADGVQLRFDLDVEGLEVGVIDGAGGRTRLDRDAVGRVLAVVLPSGLRSEVEIDALGRVIAHWRQDQIVGRFEYTDAGRIAADIDALGGRTTRRYGQHGDLIESLDVLGHSHHWTYDVHGWIASATGAGGATWSMDYDDVGSLVAVNDPSGARWTSEYDKQGVRTAVVDPLGRRREETPDAAGRLIRYEDGGTSADIERDSAGRPVGLRRPDGSEQRVTYDACGRVASWTSARGATSRYEYTPAGRVSRITLPSGAREIRMYDRSGRLVTVVDAAGSRWTTSYDVDGRPTACTSSDEVAQAFHYDDHGRLARRVGSGGTTNYTRDSAGRVIGVQDGRYGSRSVERDDMGRVVRAWDPHGATSTWEWDASSRLVTSTGTDGRTTRFAYDVVGRLISEINADGLERRFSYDVSGLLVERVDRDGHEFHLEYDRAGRVRAVRSLAGHALVLGRDERARPTRLTEEGRAPDVLVWDEDDHLVARRRGGIGLTWDYDEDGRRRATTYPDGRTSTQEVDGLGRATAIEHPLLGHLRLAREADGRLVGMAGPDVRARWTYRDGELVGYSWEGRGHRSQTDLVRDASGRVVEERVDGVVRRFAYDAGGQLIALFDAEGETAYGYDAVGRLTRENGPRGELRYSYDDAGSLLAVHRDGDQIRRCEYDSEGRRTSDLGASEARTFTWDWAGRLAAITTMTADGTTRRTAVTVDGLGELAEVNGRPLWWDTAGGGVALQWIGDDAVVGVGEPWARVSASGAVTWLDPDWQGTPADATTVDPWGTAVAGSVPGLGFRGEVGFDDVLWLRNRMYEPGSRSFLGVDPLPGVVGAAWAGNPYEYAGNDPLNALDPLGLSPVTAADLKAYRDRMALGYLGRAELATGEWLDQNKDYFIGGALVVTGVVVSGLAVASVGTGVGPFVLGAVGSGLVSAGTNTVEQRMRGERVDYREVAVSGAIGTAEGLIPGMGPVKKLTEAVGPVAAPFVLGGPLHVTAGIAERGIDRVFLGSKEPVLDGGEIFDDYVEGTADGALDDALKRGDFDRVLREEGMTRMDGKMLLSGSSAVRDLTQDSSAPAR